MKPDERAFILALAEESQRGHVYVRDLVRRLGMNEKRAAYLCSKWTDKGWYNYGVSVLAGWLEPKGREAAEQLMQEQSK